mgnify:CR=1 FL=1|tara:strand:- start:666 stop:1082 length:417 start_codon:yes stop_codon:yes gene_type:complete
MIKYNLTCECGETFESWFPNSLEFDLLRKKKLIKCVYCESSLVKKSVMAPNLKSKSNKVIEKTKFEKNIKKQLLDVRNYIEKNCKNVGENFSREARSIHYDKKTSQGIYGKTSPEEASELIEEGIDVVTIPWVDKSEN